MQVVAAGECKQSGIVRQDTSRGYTQDEACQRSLPIWYGRRGHEISKKKKKKSSCSEPGTSITVSSTATAPSAPSCCEEHCEGGSLALEGRAVFTRVCCGTARGEDVAKKHSSHRSNFASGSFGEDQPEPAWQLCGGCWSFCLSCWCIGVRLPEEGGQLEIQHHLVRRLVHVAHQTMPIFRFPMPSNMASQSAH